MGKEDEYRATMGREIETPDPQVENLNAQGAQTSGDVPFAHDMQAKVDAMRADRDLAYSKLREIRTANESAWQQQMQSAKKRPTPR